MGYALRKRKKVDGGRQVNSGPAYQLRRSSEISAEALRGAFGHNENELEAYLLGLPEFHFLQTWQWYIRGHWKQALFAAGAYALTIFLWTRLV